MVVNNLLVGIQPIHYHCNAYRRLVNICFIIYQYRRTKVYVFSTVCQKITFCSSFFLNFNVTKILNHFTGEMNETNVLILQLFINESRKIMILYLCRYITNALFYIYIQLFSIELTKHNCYIYILIVSKFTSCVYSQNHRQDITYLIHKP